MTERAVELLCRLIEVPRVSRDETAAADLLQNCMQGELGLEVKREGNNLWSVQPDFDDGKQTFKYPADFDISEYYRDSFGIIIEDGIPCEHIVIKVNSSQVKYLRSLPLHHSQKETAITPEYSIFEYDLRPTYDFEQEILSHREDFKILEPISLKKRMKEIVKSMCEMYDDLV